MREPIFELVSFPEFYKAVAGGAWEEGTQKTKEEVMDVYRKINLPRRATAASAGYDFETPFDINLLAGETIMVPTGIRVKMPSYMALLMYPRSSLGFKYKMTLDNTVGVIDADYYNADNEGHIMAAITNHGSKPLRLAAGDRFVQGIFTMYYTTADDTPKSSDRVGGLGSTGK